MKRHKKKSGSSRKILTYLNKLPQPYRELAITNAGDRVELDFKGNTIKDALMSAFVWNDSNEGGDFWNDFINNDLI